MDKEKDLKEKKEKMQALIKKKNLKIKRNLDLKNQVLKIIKKNLIKINLKNQALKTKRKKLVLQIIQNTLIKNLRVIYQKTQIKKNLKLKEKKNLRIEKDLGIFHLKDLKKKDKIFNLNY